MCVKFDFEFMFDDIDTSIQTVDNRFCAVPVLTQEINNLYHDNILMLVTY